MKPLKPTPLQIFDHLVVQGRVDEVLAGIAQVLNRFMASYGRVRIGATSDPRKRCSRAYDVQQWHKMVLLYHSVFAGQTRSMEKYLIAYAKRANFRIEIDNSMPGGEGIVEGYQNYWVYILVAEPRRPGQLQKTARRVLTQ